MKAITVDPQALAELNDRYSRVSGNVDFSQMINTVLIIIGTGASGPMVEHISRLGIKSMYLFDNKRVRKKNQVAQNFTFTDIGLQKPEALKRRLEACEFEKGNPKIPALKVQIYGDFLAIRDDELEAKIRSEQSTGRRVVIVMTSDYHPAQARANRIALRYNLSVFWVGIYRGGKAGEIIFFVPGYDLPCYRCIAKTRYNFFERTRLAKHLRGDFSGSGKSTGLPHAAYFIDSVLSHLIIGLIHVEVEDNPHGRLFNRLLRERRNLIQCQLDPDYKLNGSEDIFAQIKGPDLIAFNTIFQREDKNPNCFDCGKVALSINGWQHTDYTKEDYRKHLEATNK